MEVLRISTVVDPIQLHPIQDFGSTKNFYCCRCLAKLHRAGILEVLRISTVVDIILMSFRYRFWKY